MLVSWLDSGVVVVVVVITSVCFDTENDCWLRQAPRVSSPRREACREVGRSRKQACVNMVGLEAW